MKPYMIEIVRQMLGCKEVHGSGFLWKVTKHSLTILVTLIIMFGHLYIDTSYQFMHYPLLFVLRVIPPDGDEQGVDEAADV